MANLKSSKKDVLKNRRNHKRNVSRKSYIKTLMKKFDTLSDEKVAVELLNKVYKELDRTSISTLPVNKTSRLKSQAARKVKLILEKVKA